VPAAPWSVAGRCVALSGAGALRVPVPKEGVQVVVAACWSEQLPEEEHCADPASTPPLP